MIQIDKLNKKIYVHDIIKYIVRESSMNNAVTIQEINEHFKMSLFTLGKFIRIGIKKGIIKKGFIKHEVYYYSDYRIVFEDENNNKCACGDTITHFKYNNVYFCDECFDVIINQS